MKVRVHFFNKSQGALFTKLPQWGVSQIEDWLLQVNIYLGRTSSGNLRNIVAMVMMKGGSGEGTCGFHN